jgi:hypothetical protein
MFILGLLVGIVIMCALQVNKTKDDEEEIYMLLEENMELSEEVEVHKDMCKAKDVVIAQLEEQVEVYRRMLVTDNYKHIPRID